MSIKNNPLKFFILCAAIGGGLFFSLGNQAHASITLVQSTSSIPNPNGVSSASKAFGNNVAKGDLIVVGTYNGIGNTITATDTLGDTFVDVASVSNTSDHDENILIATTSAAGADTITVNDASAGIAGFSIHEYSGTVIDTISDIVDASSTNIGNGTSLSSGNLTTHNAGDLVFAYFATGDDNANTLFTYSSAYTQRETAPGITGFCAAVNVSANCIASEDATFNSATSTNATTTISQGSDQWTGIAVAFKMSSFSSLGISYVNKVSKASSTATTCALPVMTGASVGNTLIVAAQVKTATTTTATIADTNSNSWVTASQATGTAGSNFIFYAPITALSSGKTTTTVTFSSSVTNSCQEALFSGLAVVTSTLLDVTTSTSGGTTALKSGTSTTNYSAELLIGGGIAAPTSTTFTAGSGFTMGATSTLGAMEYRIVSATSSYSAPMTLGASTTWLGAIAALRAPPDAISITYTTGVDGGVSGAAETITGNNFGTVSSGNRATCSGGAGTGCIQFVVGGTATVAASSISAWTDKSITFTVSSTLASNGGVNSLQVSAASSTDSTLPTFYIYPNITSVAALDLSGASIPSARTYNASDTDGLIMLQGDHFGTSGTSTILGYAATQYGSTGGSCATAGYTATSACLEVPTAIPTSTYSGTIILNRGSDNKQATTSLNILPRILALNPTSTPVGSTVQILGDHLCQGGTCPTSANWTSSSFKVSFGSVTSTSFVAQTGGSGACNGSGAAWTDGEICVQVPSGLSVGSATTTVISDTVSTNMFGFTVAATALPGTPGTPTYTNLASSTPSTLTVNWSAASNANYYTPERSTSSAFTSPTPLATTSATSVNDSSLSANTTYYYEVYATNGGGNGSSSASSSVLTYPAAPGTPTFSGISASALTVNWTPPTNGASYYKVEQAPDSGGSPGTFTQITTTTATSTNVNGLSASTTYWYRIRATNGTGDGSYSNNASTTTSGFVNSPPNAPTENAPVGGMQDVSTAPTFTLTATDPNSNNIQYRINLYSGGSCAGSVTTYNQNSSQSGWSGQNASSSAEYTSGTQGSYAASGLITNTTYSWTSNAIDPEGSNTWGATSTCVSFTTTYGNWTTDAGSWSINGSNQLAVTPAAGISTQIHVTGLTKTSYIIEFQAKTSGSFSEYRDSVSGGTLTPLIGSTLSVASSSILSGGPVGLTASSTGGATTFDFDDFAVYTGTTISMASLPSGGSWGILNTSGNLLSGTTCQTGNSWNLSSYSAQIPLNQDNGGGYVAVWTNGSCTGAANASTTLEVGASGIYGGDAYSYGSGSGIMLTGGSTPTETSTITVNAVGTVSY
jgi:hypothetical protein